MKLKLFLLMLLTAAVPAIAQRAAVSGSVVAADTGNPVAGAIVTLQNQGITVTTGPAGDFLISNAQPGVTTLTTIAYGYTDATKEVELFSNQTVSVGAIVVTKEDLNQIYYEEAQEMWYDENALEGDDDGGSQTIQALTSASDDIYYNASNYNFQPMYFRYRGLDSQYQSVYLNGIELNDMGRGRFSYSTLGGMTSRAFRNRTNTLGLGAAAYGFGGLAGRPTSTPSPCGSAASTSFATSTPSHRAIRRASTGR